MEILMLLVLIACQVQTNQPLVNFKFLAKGQP